MTARCPITTHVLDTARGVPAAGVKVTLRHGDKLLAAGVTNADGRITDLLPPGPIEPGEYTLDFDTGDYAKTSGHASFFPRVSIHFILDKPDAHYHVPLLLSPYGYSTYRGS
ncbi:MAG: hydroxyisourate hydrolase [Planctomycetes bacterium]|nr:hydroxyisourate hydrolase [Planctomycetota bacterium]